MGLDAPRQPVRRRSDDVPFNKDLAELAQGGNLEVHEWCIEKDLPRARLVLVATMMDLFRAGLEEEHLGRQKVFAVRLRQSDDAADGRHQVRRDIEQLGTIFLRTQTSARATGWDRGIHTRPRSLLIDLRYVCLPRGTADLILDALRARGIKKTLGQALAVGVLHPWQTRVPAVDLVDRAPTECCEGDLDIARRGRKMARNAVTGARKVLPRPGSVGVTHMEGPHTLEVARDHLEQVL
mmetsp:Transcript_7760/g.15701  ORF Transcript_7760/g.15701 Transcript_7760/m.15701 type:complete len:238 (-) Transcript_7760:184-897(-)